MFRKLTHDPSPQENDRDSLLKEIEMLRERVAYLEDNHVQSRLLTLNREDVQANELNLDKAFELLPQGVAIFDRKGNLIRLNEMGRTLLEVDDISQFNQIQDYSKYQPRFLDGSPLPFEEWPIQRAIHGETFNKVLVVVKTESEPNQVIECSGFPIFGEQGVAELAVVVFNEIGREREMNRLKDLFISIVSHELRTPLTSIKGYGQLLQRNLKKRHSFEMNTENPAMQDLLDRDTRAINAILSQTEMMATLISEMLDFSRVQTGKFELRRTDNSDISNLVRSIVDAERASGVDRKFVLQCPDYPILCNYDTVRIDQVLNNLLGNAIKYSQAGKTITIGVEQWLDGKAVALQENPNQVVIWIKDEGIGISRDQQPYIFDTFYRARTQKTSEVDGLGLGLYISREIVQQHGGKMWLNSELDKGSTFYFSIPC